MEFTVEGNRIPIKSWCADVETEAMRQAVNLARHPETFHHVALMPDCHAGYGMPVGGVMACAGAVIPNAVGVDIGCGMCAVRTAFPSADIRRDLIRNILEDVKRAVPAGFSHHRQDQNWDGFENAPPVPVIRRELPSARRQLGTLGGGNHFIEIQAGSDSRVWLMLHSGSRNFGLKIAREYNAKAKDLCAKDGNIRARYGAKDDLAFLPAGSQIGCEYMAAMDFALLFALENRRRMMHQFKESVSGTLSCSFDDEINIHHNYAAREEHFGRSVIVHRKGATCADKGQRGIIPGSMGTPSYIVSGRGNPESFRSCSHGAGRIMGRKAFNRTHSAEECRLALGDVVFDGWNSKNKDRCDLSEAPQAYKDIRMVMNNQKDLVDVLVELRPLGVLKG